MRTMAFIPVFALLLLAACGGDSGSNPPPAPQAVDVHGSWKGAIPPVILGADTLVPDTVRLRLELAAGGDSLFTFSCLDSSDSAMFDNQGAWRESTTTILRLLPSSCSVRGAPTPSSQDSLCVKPMLMRIVNADTLSIDFGNMKNAIVLMGIDLGTVLANPQMGPFVSQMSVRLTRAP